MRLARSSLPVAEQAHLEHPERCSVFPLSYFMAFTLRREVGGVGSGRKGGGGLVEGSTALRSGRGTGISQGDSEPNPSFHECSQQPGKATYEGQSTQAMQCHHAVPCEASQTK